MKQGDGFSAGLSALLGVTLTAPEKKGQPGHPC